MLSLSLSCPLRRRQLFVRNFFYIYILQMSIDGGSPEVDKILIKKGLSFKDIDNHIKKYQADHFKAFVSIFNTLIIIILCYGSYFWVVKDLPILWPIWIFVRAGLFLRIYIYFHDCTHGSFFSNPTANLYITHFIPF